MKNFGIFGAILFLSFFLSLSGQPDVFQLEETSRFGHTIHNTYSGTLPVVDYPYLYTPDDFGVQVCLWDSLEQTVEPVGQLGLTGWIQELVIHGDRLFAAAKYLYQDLPPGGRVMLYALDISNLPALTVTDSLMLDDQWYTLRNLSFSNGVLCATKMLEGMPDNLVLIDPVTLQIMVEVIGINRFHILPTGHLITRLSELFSIYQISHDGLEEVGEVNLGIPQDITFSFVNIDDHIVGIVADHACTLWDISEITDWSLIGQAPYPAGEGVRIGDKIAGSTYDSETQQYQLTVLDIQDIENPSLLHTIDYPDSLGFVGLSSIGCFGNYGFQQGWTTGAFVFRLDSDGFFESIRRCYSHNVYPSKGARFGPYLLQPEKSRGVTVWNTEDIHHPMIHDRILENLSYPLDCEVNGSLLLIGGSFETNQYQQRIYELSTLETPVLIMQESGFTPVYIRAFQFDPLQANGFYKFSSNGSEIEHYVVQNQQPELVFAYDTDQLLFNPVFTTTGRLFFCDPYDTPGRQLYFIDGIPEQQPQATVQADFPMPDEGHLYPCGAYAMIRNITDNPGNPFQTLFTNGQTLFETRGGAQAFPFFNFIGVARQTEVDLYNVSQNPSGWLEPDYTIPTFSPVGRLVVQENHIDNFSYDHIALLSSDWVEAIDAECPSTPDYNFRCFPNPFNPETTFSFTLDAPAQVEVALYNIRGQKIGITPSRHYPAGKHKINWMADEAASGVYLGSLVVNGKTVSIRKITLLK